MKELGKLILCSKTGYMAFYFKATEVAGKNLSSKYAMGKNGLRETISIQE